MNQHGQQSKFQKKYDFRFCVDSSLNKNKSLGDNDIGFLDQVSPPQVSPPQVQEIKLVNQNFTEFILVKMRNWQWLNLAKLNLDDNKIRTIGCKYITQISMTSLTNITLTKNQISSYGAHHLIKGDWPLLSHLEIEFDWLHSKVIATVIRGNWPTLKQLNVRQINKNEISNWVFWELMTIHNAKSIRNINIGNKQLTVNNFFKRLLAKAKDQSDTKVVAQLKKKFINLPPFYDR